jgi:hypothetical protein
MYQIEVKRQLVACKFLPSTGWSVTVDLDTMERGIGGQHPQGKRAIAEQCERWFEAQGVKLGVHPSYKRADLVAEHQGKGTFVVEVEGESSRQREQALYSALGQTLLAMTRFEEGLQYGVAVPDLPTWERQLLKVPIQVCQRLNLRLLLVSRNGVRTLDPENGTAARAVFAGST